MTQLFAKFLKLLLVIYVFIFAYEWWRPAPDDIVRQSGTFMVPEKGVKFYADLDTKDKKGNLMDAKTIQPRYQELLKNAAHLVLIGEAYVPENGSSSIATLLTAKHLDDKHAVVGLITDPISTRYGGINSASLEAQRKLGTLVIQTDMDAMPDSNLFYTSLWRPFFSWWGNSPTGGWLPDPMRKTTEKVTLRTWLAFLNMKMNDSHFLLVDAIEGKGTKRISLFEGSDISTPRGSTGAVALEVDDRIWSQLFGGQATIAGISGSGLPSFGGSDIDDASGALRVSMVNIMHLREKIIALIKEMNQNDQLDIAARFISDRDIINELKSAANRNVNIRIILDPNEEVLGQPLFGMPNRPVAKELTSVISGGAAVRWCDPRALPCESRLMLGKSASTTFIMLGGADLTRRSIGGYNVESEVLIESPHDFTAAKDAESYFNKIWDNDGGSYTVDYSRYEDDTLWRASLFRIMEMTGISYY